MSNLALPGNPRYQPKNLRDFFGYDNLFRYVAEVEIATLRTLIEVGIVPATEGALLTPELEEKLLGITTTEVDEIERTITKHDIRAWVRSAQSILPAPLRRWVHIPLTSYDPIDTARTLQFRRAHEKVVSPLVHEVVRIMSEKVREYAEVIQVGRTHGQHALPITVGFWLGTTLGRILTNARQMDACADQLLGKISGAVGAYNAQAGLGIMDACPEMDFERLVLNKLGLKPGLISTQILPPEGLAYYLFAATMLSASFGQLGRDCRHLMRTEIGEISEPFAAGQAGSSTMANKRNPITLENLEGMWLKTKNEYGKVFDTLISEHQRDLVGSSLARDFPTIIVNLVHQLNTLLRLNDKDESFLQRLTVDVAACERNFNLQSDRILAEPIYIALQMAGYEGDAHELVNRRAMPLVNEDTSLIDAIQSLAEGDDSLAAALDSIPGDTFNIFRDPRSYTGLAYERAMAVYREAHVYGKTMLWRASP